MGQTNPCLRRTFAFFNVLFAILGVLIILLAVVSQVVQSSHRVEQFDNVTGLVVLYVIGSVTMVIGILGAYGAQKESRPALIVFLNCMVIGTVLMLKMGVPLAVARPQVEEVTKSKLREYLPLDEAPADVKNMAETLQEAFACCGLFSYQDWRNEIPDSCLCDPELLRVCQTVDYKDLMLPQMKSKSVYSLTCFPVMWHYLSIGFDIVLGTVFTLAILAILGLVLSSVMIHQLRSASRATTVLSVPAIFSPKPPPYQELHNKY